MIYLLLITICFLAHFLNIRRKHKQLFIVMLVSLFISMLFFMLYLIRHSYYYNILNQYFNIGKNLWMYLSRLPVTFDFLIRGINIFSLLFIYTSVCFWISFSGIRIVTDKKKMYMFLAIPVIMELLIYDPYIYERIYCFLYPEYIQIEALLLIQAYIHKITQGVNFLYLALGIGCLIYKYMVMPKVRVLKQYMLLISFVYASMAGYYVLVMMWAPSFLVKVQKIADSVQYKKISLEQRPYLYKAYPSFLLFSSILIFVSFYLHSKSEKKIAARELVISKNFTISTNMTRVFGHYLKNEILSFGADTEYLKQLCCNEEKVNSEIERIISSMQLRCNHIYERLDYLNRNIDYPVLKMEICELSELLTDMIKRKSHILGSIQVITDLEISAPVLADRSYLNEAIENIFMNALEELNAIEKEEKSILVHLTMHSQWIIVEIEDNGSGLSASQIDKVFTPFYTTKTVKENWGIGLSISYNIVRAHKGKIVVESKEGKWTKFEILLPKIG